MTDELESLVAAIREDCPRAVWSQGVSLARSASLTVEPSDDDDEVVLRFTLPGVPVARTVRLLLEDEDYLCDCSPLDDACEHVAASVIMYRKAVQSGNPLPVAKAADGRISYALVRSGGGVGLRRTVVVGGQHREIKGAVLSFARRIDVRVTTGPTDLELERALGLNEFDWIPPGKMKGTLRLLSRLDNVLFDGRKVSMSQRPIGAVARLVDAPRGLLLSVIQSPLIDEVFNNSVVRCGDTFQPLSEVGLTARELQIYRKGRLFTDTELSELMSVVLPDLRGRIEVDTQGATLPTLVDVPAYLEVHVEVEGHELVVSPGIAYGDPVIARVNGDALTLQGDAVPERDREREFSLLRQVRRDLQIDPHQETRFAGESAVIFADRLKRWHGMIRGEALETFELLGALHASVSLSDATNGVQQAGQVAVHFDFTLPGQVTRRASPSAVFSAWQANESLVPLLDGGWASLPIDWLSRCGEIASELLRARDAKGVVPKSSLLDVARLCDSVDVEVPSAVADIRRLISDFEAVPDATLPNDLTAVLRDYQREGVNWLMFLRDHGLGALLADDMGLGKTVQALCVLEGRSLVVVPTSVMSNWLRESTHFRPALKVAVYHGPKRRLEDDADVTITSYALLRLDIDRLSAEQWDVVVLDEAQAIKNPASQVSRAARRLDAKAKITLTGTPVENRLDELWSQFDFIAPGLLGSKESFLETYERPILNGAIDVAKRLQNRIKPFILRRLKSEVAPELPPRTDVVLHCELSPSERALYDAVRLSTREDVVERLMAGGSVMEALEALLRLRQAACHSGLLPGQSAEESSKLRLVTDTLGELSASGHKSLVFSQWTTLLDFVEPMLSARGLRYVRLDGSTNDRGAVVDAFQEDTSVDVMLLSLRAGGTGLNLTAADHVFLLDPWWNPAVEDQAADRAHRIGQEKPVFVHRLVSLDTVEERILERQQAKRAIAEAALGGGTPGSRLTREDLMSLLQS